MIIKIYAPNKWLHKGAMEALLVEGHTEQQKIELLQLKQPVMSGNSNWGFSIAKINNRRHFLFFYF